jgi:hypothetical protein
MKRQYNDSHSMKRCLKGATFREMDKVEITYKDNTRNVSRRRMLVDEEVSKGEFLSRL